MRETMQWIVAGALMLATATGARADRYQRGLALYQLECTSCHSTGWKNPGPPEHARLDLTRVVDRRGDADLRRWLADPAREKTDTGCRHTELSREQIDDLLNFFHTRASEPPTKPKAARGGGGGDRERRHEPVQPKKRSPR